MELNSELDRLEKYKPIEQALIKAKQKHPNYPDNWQKRMSILIEEVGEVAQAILDYEDSDGTIDDIKKELYQSAAMCLRFLENLPITNNIQEIEEPVVLTKDDLWDAWWASAIKTISFSGVDKAYERRCFETWLKQRNK